MNSPKGTILIIEDEVGFRRVYQDVLKNEGYNVLVAEDGEAGWQMVRLERPNLVLLDLALPKLHGFDVLHNIRTDETTKDIPVLIMTVLGEEKDVRKGIELGANDYMVKGSFSPRELLAKVHSMEITSEMKESITTYKVALYERKLDATQLQRDVGLVVLSSCPHCGESELALELTPDGTRTDGHWFSAHFVCPKCEMYF